jgi:lycopene cyclase domain-containing protein
MTYLLLSLLFVAIALAVLAIALALAPDRANLVRRWRAPMLLAGAALLVLTAVFDNAMIAVGLMTYAGAHISGARVGLAPLEDFAYPIAGLLLLPSVWLLLRPRPGRRHATRDGRS